MVRRIHLCGACWTYTMRTTCPKCKQPTTLAKPPKYRADDRWGDYRRRAKDAESTA
jgi:rRNA maturation protein Nop10